MLLFCKVSTNNDAVGFVVAIVRCRSRLSMVGFVVARARVPHTQGDRVLVACIEVPAVGCRSTAVISISVRGDRSCLVSEKTVRLFHANRMPY